MKPFLVSAFILVFILPCAAAQAVSEHIIVTASAVPESLESTPASVTVITRRDIDRQEARDVADLLRQVPGAAIARNGSPGKSSTLFLRGGSSKQALVLWNGVPMNDAYLSGYNFGQLSTAGVDRIEVIRGPYSALYGSDAVSGVVNVLTTPQRSSLGLELEAGGNGVRSGSLSGGAVGNAWSAYGSLERRDDDGFAPNDDFTSDTLTGGAQAAAGSHVTVGLMGRHNRFNVGLPRNVNADATAFVPSLHRRERGTESEVSVPIRFETTWLRYDLRLSDTERTDHFGDPDGPFGPEFGNTDSSLRTARLSAQSRQTAFGVLTFGSEWERSNVDHTDSYGLDVRHRSRNSNALFVEDRFWRDIGSGSVQASAGARYDRFDSFGSQVSPRLAVAWAAGSSKVRAAYGAGFRAPAIGELFAPFFGNPDLHAERSVNSELGFDRYIGSSMLSVTLFRSNYDDLISYDVAANRFGNIARAQAKGVELGGSDRIGKFSFGVSYTWLKAIDADTGQQLPRRPRNSGSVVLGYELGAVTAQLIVEHAGRRPDVTEIVPFGAVTNAPYTTEDVVLHYNAGSFSPFLKIENATDRRYDEVFGYPAARRRAIAGLRYAIR
ncbi:MAG TPA: TonB-dependent receptor [Thermoanaerobaculia bacterium]|nr:TonB-dependent receptor [Thermoanaerobaculia bacterium]